MVGKRTFTGRSPVHETYDRSNGYSNDYARNGDLESGSQSGGPRFKDVVNLAVSDKKKADITGKLKAGLEQQEFEKYYTPQEKLDKIKNKKIRRFYECQNEVVDDWIEIDTLVLSLADNIVGSMDPDADHDGVRERSGALQGVGERVEELLPQETREHRARANRNAKWAINVNVLANILLLLFKIMVISFLQVLQESVEKLLPKGDHSTANLPPIAIGAMAATIVIKGIIWIGCARVKTTQVQALAQDCKTDVYFNTLSLLFPLIGGRVGAWWLDPVGAALLSLFIIYDWGQTCFENVTRLSGSAVDDRLQKKLTFLAYRFSPIVEGVKSITAYHAGDGVWAEYDILLNEKESLHRAHDIAETMQYCLEGISEVDRAFVTTDYTTLGPTGHTTDQA
ncbi:MAG: hypothetical protein Q9160_004620 [Pyrenula sp. 1 TL-2023]